MIFIGKEHAVNKILYAKSVIMTYGDDLHREKKFSHL